LVGCEVVEEKTVAPASGAGYFKAELLSEVALEEMRGGLEGGDCVGGPEGIVRLAVGK